MSRAALSAVAAVALFGALAVPAAAASAAPEKAESVKPLTVKLAWYLPAGTAVDTQAKAIAAAIEKMSHGSIKVETYPGGSLLTETNMAHGLENNLVQMGVLGVHWWANQEPSTSFDSIPFLVPGPEKMLKALHGQLGNDLRKILERHGVTIAGWGFYGYSGDYINNKHPIETPADFKGLHMRSDGPLPAEFMKKYGAVATTIDSSEVYTALQRGTLDGATSGMSSFISRKWIEVCKYVTAMKAWAAVYPTQVNAAWWNGLTPKQRDIISKAVASTEQANIKAINAEYNKDIQLAKEAGAHVYIPKGQVLATWKKDARFMTAYYLEKAGADGKKILHDLKPYEGQVG